MVYHELTTQRQVYFARPSQNKPVLALLIHDIPLRNIVEPLNQPNVQRERKILCERGAEDHGKPRVAFSWHMGRAPVGTGQNLRSP